MLYRPRAGLKQRIRLTIQDARAVTVAKNRRESKLEERQRHTNTDAHPLGASRNVTTAEWSYRDCQGMLTFTSTKPTHATTVECRDGSRI